MGTLKCKAGRQAGGGTPNWHNSQAGGQVASGIRAPSSMHCCYLTACSLSGNRCLAFMVKTCLVLSSSPLAKVAVCTSTCLACVGSMKSQVVSVE